MGVSGDGMNIEIIHKIAILWVSKKLGWLRHKF